MTIAFYPGSFDPVTYGHIDIVTRAAAIFPKLIVGVFESPPKNLLFNTQERIEMFSRSVEALPNVEVCAYHELTVAFAQRIGAKAVVRGLRMATDFDFEFEMTLMNRKLAPDVDVVCMMTSLEYQYISSTLLKEVARMGGDIHDFVPPHVAGALRDRLR